MIQKQTFISAINSIQEQHKIDLDKSYALEKVFGCEGVNIDNSLLANSILELLRVFFPRVDGHCEIEHWCYVLDFGKCGDEIISVEDLWDNLNQGL